MEKQKKWRFNLIDVLFLVVVLAGVLFVALRMAGPDETAGGGPEDYYVITFTCDTVPSYLVDHLQLSAEVTDDGMKRSLGRVVDIQRGPSVYYNTDSSGRLVKSSRDGYDSLLLMCCVKCADNGYGITVDELNLGIGHTITIRADGARISSAVYNIQKLSDTVYTLPEG